MKQAQAAAHDPRGLLSPDRLLERRRRRVECGSFVRRPRCFGHRSSVITGQALVLADARRARRINRSTCLACAATSGTPWHAERSSTSTSIGAKPCMGQAKIHDQACRWAACQQIKRRTAPSDQRSLRAAQRLINLRESIGAQTYLSRPTAPYCIH